VYRSINIDTNGPGKVPRGWESGAHAQPEER